MRNWLLVHLPGLKPPPTPRLPLLGAQRVPILKMKGNVVSSSWVDWVECCDVVGGMLLGGSSKATVVGNALVASIGVHTSSVFQALYDSPFAVMDLVQ